MQRFGPFEYEDDHRRCEVYLAIDVEKIAMKLASRACRSTGKRATRINGLVIVEVFKVELKKTR